MAISFVGGANASLANGGDASVTLPGGMAADDLIICVYGIGCAADRGTTVMLTAGYTAVADLYSNATNDAMLGAFYKYHVADTTAQVEGFGNAADAVGACVLVFRGVALSGAGGPFDVTSTTATGIDVLDPNPPSITTSGGAGIWTVIGGVTGSAADSAGTYTFPTGYTTNAQQVGRADNNDVNVGMGYNTAPATTEDPGIMDHSGATTTGMSWAAITMALKPAAEAIDAIVHYADRSIYA